MLRPASDRDSEDIRRWRNHPQVRAASLTTHEIGPAEHATWFAAARADPTRRVLIYEFDGTGSGVVNFFDIDAAAKAARWGFFLDLDGLDSHGATLPAWVGIERDAVAYAFDALGVDTLRGEVREDNTVVRRMNKRFGFVEGEPESQAVDGVPHRVVPISLSRSAHEARLAKAARTA